MQTQSKTLSQIIADADAAADQAALEAAIKQLDELLEDGFVQAEAPSRPYSARIEMTEAFRTAHMPPETGGAEGAFGDTIGGMAIDVANALSRARRRASYRLKTLFGFNGLRIVEEGDSWTQYPLLLQDIGDQLHANSDIAVFSVGAAGDLVSNMAAEKEYLGALDKTGASALLLSGGGNDLFGTLKDILIDFSAGAEPGELIDDRTFGPLLATVIQSYETILGEVAVNFPHVTVFGHGYDLPYPLDDGKWIGPALEARGIPFDTGRAVLKVILDRFNEALQDLAARHGNLIYCDLREKVDRGPNSWFDELHPKNAGYGRAADVLEAAIRSRLSGGAELARVGGDVGAGTGGGERRTTLRAKTIVLDPGHGGRTTVGGSSPNNATGPNGTLERDLTLDVAKRTRNVLEDRGFRVLLTRDTDVNLGLSDRAAIARNAGADAFVSIHFNASDLHNAQGTETFVHTSAPAGGHPSKTLCRAVQAEMVAALGLRDRNALHPGGIKRGGFGVINPSRHATHTAAVLHEVSFLDRADEERKLATVSYKRKIAIALADGIETYLEGIAPAESLQLAQAEIGDAVELAQLEAGIATDADRLFDWSGMPISDEAVFGGGDDVSNGHLLAAEGLSRPSGSFVTDLAAVEARFVEGYSHDDGAGGDEGDEPSEYDPAVERAFGATSAHASANVSLLAEVFRGAETTHLSSSDFETFILGLGLRHFSPGEFLVMGNRNKSGPCKGKNTMPPRHLWPNIANTARMIDQIRMRLGAPVYITSAYRSPAYNSCIDGASRSQHMRFNALDWYCASGSLSSWHAAAKAVSATSAQFRGFIKAYPSGNFVHIDTRDA